ncbi:hypothetical protein [Polaromonas sp.]|uniref:hypothetical protein n=1 Tax=Polaromonas sp. TaxID=1869339 RepID=UPI003264B742
MEIQNATLLVIGGGPAGYVAATPQDVKHRHDDFSTMYDTLYFHAFFEKAGIRDFYKHVKKSGPPKFLLSFFLQTIACQRLVVLESQLGIALPNARTGCRIAFSAP